MSSMSIDIELLKTVKYFVGINPSELAMIKPRIIEKTLKTDEILLVEGEWSDFLYFVISGMVKVYKTASNGREQILRIACGGDSVNDVSTFDRRPSVASMIALNEVTLYALSRNDLNAAMRESSQLCLNIIQSLASRVRHDSNLVEELSSYQAVTRLAKLLTGKHAGEETSVGLILNQQNIAGMIGASREVVNRSLKIMEKSGAIVLKPHRVVVLDKNLLSEFAEEIDNNN
jgi:CRP/FNR family transcriptional regulator, cyclic AMP receptor protein